jgi:hypothetical protein
MEHDRELFENMENQIGIQHQFVFSMSYRSRVFEERHVARSLEHSSTPWANDAEFQRCKESTITKRGDEQIKNGASYARGLEFRGTVNAHPLISWIALMTLVVPRHVKGW